MRRLLLLLALVAGGVLSLFAQYPHVTVRQLQEVPMDSLLIADTLKNFSVNTNQARWTLQTSPYNGDTVIVTGIVVVPPMVITYTASGMTMVLYDTVTANQSLWGGILVRADTVDRVQLTADGFFSVSPGDTVSMVGVISEFPTSRGYSLTQFKPIAGNPITLGAVPGPLPKPLVMTTGDFYHGLFPAGKIQYSTGEPHEGMLVEFHNLTIDNKVNTTRGTFACVDDAGNEISEYDMSRYFTLGQSGWPDPDTNWAKVYAGLGVGFRIDTLRGIITTSSGSEGPRGYRIAPLYPGDIVFGVAPPAISSHRRNPVVVAPDSSPNVSVKAVVQTQGATIQAVTAHYSVNNGPFLPLPMTYQASDTTYNTRIPVQAADSFVRYYIVATDDQANSTLLASSAIGGYASDTSKGFFFYTVLNRPLAIRDVQYTPFLNGRTPYLGAVAILSGIVTADTAHIGLSAPSTGSTTAWYMQSTSQPWSGIWLTTGDTAGQRKMAAVRNGDSITVTGTVQENFDVTRLGNISAVTVNSSGNPEPAPVVVTSGSLNVGNGIVSAEQYEGMLVRLNHVTVVDTAPTYSDDTEYLVDDGSGGVIVQQGGRNKYSNRPQDTTFGKVLLHKGDTINSLTGIVYYSFNQYKFVPRTDADFGGINTAVDEPALSQIPRSYSLEQNYPNPFNPSTTIEYALPKSGLVSLKVYNILGQQVKDLVHEVQAAGHQRVRFDAGSLATGVYFYRIQAGSFTQVKKMLLLK